jgi:hypothetical protein
LPITGEGPSITACEGIGTSYVSAYNDNKDCIFAATGGDVDLMALTAAMITVESGWDKNAKSPCGAVGIAQFIRSTAIGYGLNVPEYEMEECGPCNDLLGYRKKVSVCNSCTPNKCDINNDQRLRPEKAIPAMVDHIKDLVSNFGDSGGTYEDVIKTYHGGENEQLKQQHYDGVKPYFDKWKACLSG